jgi:hypothetical protein
VFLAPALPDSQEGHDSFRGRFSQTVEAYRPQMQYKGVPCGTAFYYSATTLCLIQHDDYRRLGKSGFAVLLSSGGRFDRDVHVGG